MPALLPLQHGPLLPVRAFRGAVAGSVLIWLERITNVALTAAICRRLRTVPFYRTSDGSRIHSRIAPSLPLDLSRLAAKGVAIHPRK